MKKMYCMTNGVPCKHLVEGRLTNGNTYYYCGYEGRKPPDTYVFGVAVTKKDLEFYGCAGKGKTHANFD